MDISMEYPLNELKNFGDGLNIEGGSVYQYLNPNQIWANLCIIMDRPFVDGIEFHDIKKRNIYPLKESSVLDYNEPLVNFAYVEILHYYLIEAHQLTKKSMREEVKILVQVHRKSTGPTHIVLLEKLIDQCYPELRKVRQNLAGDLFEFSSYSFLDLRVKMIFCYGDQPSLFGKAQKYVDADMIVSFSLGGGLNPSWNTGSLLIPHTWIPFSLDEMLLCEDKKYDARNHLIISLQKILENQNSKTLEIINRDFCSPNPLKVHKARFLKSEDFKPAVIIQAREVMNPSKLSKTFRRRS